MSFHDHFSNKARDYSIYRPKYPEPLFDFIFELCKEKKLAWDAATGNGQAAISLAERFEKVIATDASLNQIQNAERKENIEYRVFPSEKTNLENSSVDLITVAQAIHWFKIHEFYSEVKRVSKEGAILAVWTYGVQRLDPEIKDIIKMYYKEIVGPYWPKERKLVEDGYRDLAFPFEKISAPEFQIEANWTMDELLGYLGTWSASEKYRKEKNEEPLEKIYEPLLSAWGNEQKRKCIWPITLIIGKVAG